MLFYILLFLPLFIINDKYFTLAAKCTDQEGHKNDADIARMMSIGQFGRTFPENFKQWNDYCK